MFKWIPGRLGFDYSKFILFQSNFFKCDCTILRMGPGSYIGEHVDPVDVESIKAGYTQHHRINIILKRANGGIFSSSVLSSEESEKKRIVKFRPDIEPHKVSEIKSGRRYILTIGWLSKCKLEQI